MKLAGRSRHCRGFNDDCLGERDSQEKDHVSSLLTQLKSQHLLVCGAATQHDVCELTGHPHGRGRNFSWWLCQKDHQIQQQEFATFFLDCTVAEI